MPCGCNASCSQATALWCRRFGGWTGLEYRAVLQRQNHSLRRILQNFQSVLAQAIEDSQPSLPVQRVMNTAREFHLTAYEAEYLDSARIQQLPLATLGRRLEEAAMWAGISMLR
jgi:predicted nucleic acid-binding protein